MFTVFTILIKYNLLALCIHDFNKILHVYCIHDFDNIKYYHMHSVFTIFMKYFYHDYNVSVSMILIIYAF